MFELQWTEEAKQNFNDLKADASRTKRYRAVRKALKFLAANPRHKSLQTHEYTSLKGPHGEKIFAAYAESKTPGAYRIFWRYGPDRRDGEGRRTAVITVEAITPHP